MNDVSVESYKPSDDEPFMNDRQKEYFRRKLIAWRELILAESRDTLAAFAEAAEFARFIALMREKLGAAEVR